MDTIKQKSKKDTYDQEYKKANYDQFIFRAKKGKKEEYRQAAEDFGLGLTEMFRLAVETFIAERSLYDLPVKPAPKTPPEEKLSSEERKLLDEFSKLPPDVQKSIAKMIRAINTELESNKIRAGE